MATRFSRLLLAYPRWHRRLHGPDMLTALEDCAAADRPVSARRFVLDGIACRLRVRGAGAKLIAACVSLVAAAGLAAGVSWVGWQATVKPWPSVEQATRMAGPMLPPGTPDRTWRRDQTLVTWLAESDRIPSAVLGTPEINEGGVELTYSWPSADVPGALAQIERRAADAGWQTTLNDNYDLVARRDGMRVRVLSFTGNTTVRVSPDVPAPAYHLGRLGAAAGALLGWLAAAAAIARYRRVPPPARSFAHAASLLGVSVLIPATLLNLAALGLGSDSLNIALPWIGYEVFAARPGAILGGLCLCVAWLLTIIGKGDEVSAAAAR